MTEQGTTAPTAAGLVRRFRWPLSLAAALALYALAGFVLVPRLIERELPGLVRTALNRDGAVEAVQFNPFSLELRARGLALSDNGAALARIDELVVNLEVEGLFRRAVTLSELSLRAPYLNVVRDRSGSINLLELGPAEDSEAGEATGELPRLIVRRFRIEDGNLDFTDLSSASGFRTRVAPFGIALDEVSTLPGSEGRHDVAITLESGTRIALRGDVVVSPLRVRGDFTLDGPFLGTVHRYVAEQLAFEVAGGESHIKARFDIVETTGSGLEARLDGFEARVQGVQLTSRNAPDFLGFGELLIDGGELRWPAQDISLESLRLVGLKATGQLDADGNLDIETLLTPRDPGASAVSLEPARTEHGTQAQAVSSVAPLPLPEPPPAEPAADWTVRIARLALEDARLALTDNAPRTPATFTIADLDLALQGVSTEPGARAPLELAVEIEGGGKMTAKGDVVLLPELALDVEVAGEGLPLTLAQPYLADVARIGIRSGALALDGHVVVDAEEKLGFDGDVRILGLDTRDLVKDEKLLAWNELGIDDLQLSLGNDRARIARVRLVKPFGRLFIAPDQSTNVGALFIEDAGEGATSGAAPAAQAAPVASEPEAPFRVRVGRVTIARGEVDFTDQSLPLPFAARIENLSGEVTTIDTRSNAPSRIKLEGRVGEYGLATMAGQLRVSAPTELADVGVQFRNIEMVPYSPYTAKFAGRKIASGRIDLDLRYRLTERQMVGENRIVIDKLELGEKVDSPDAIDLPLGLAIALLKDADGRIDIDMPVSGSLDDPQFGVGTVLWKAFVNLITKIATSPFRLLGNLIGVESDELGTIEFPPGRADLQPPEKEKLLRIAEALGKRPDIGVEVPAAVDPQADAAVLRDAKTQARIEAALGGPGAAPPPGRALDRRTRKIVEGLFVERFPTEPLAEVQARFQAPPPDEPEARPRLDELAYLDELRARVAAVESIGEAELGALGDARVAAIAAELATAGVAPARVRAGEPKKIEAREGRGVPLELGVGAAAD